MPDLSFPCSFPFHPTPPPHSPIPPSRPGRPPSPLISPPPDLVPTVFLPSFFFAESIFTCEWLIAASIYDGSRILIPPFRLCLHSSTLCPSPFVRLPRVPTVLRSTPTDHGRVQTTHQTEGQTGRRRPGRIGGQRMNKLHTPRMNYE